MVEIKEANSLNEKILDNIWTGVWAVDKNDNFIFFNKSMELISKVTKEKILGKNLMSFMPEKAIGEETHFWELFLRVKHSLKPTPYTEIPVVYPNGTLSYQSGVLVPLLDEKGNYDGMICTIEYVAERELREKIVQRALETETKLDAIYKNSPVIAFLWTAEKDWPVEYVSENIAQLGYTPEEFTSRRLIYGDIIHPDDLDMVRSTVTELEIGGRTYYTKEYRLLTKSGEVRWVLERSMLGRTEVGEPAYYQGIVIDITDRKKAEEELQKYADELAKLNEELRSLDKMKDEFISNVSHELKTPLVSIKGYSDLLHDGTLGAITAEQDKALDTVLRNSDRLKHLVDSLLFMSRVQAGTVEYVFERIQIADVIEHALMDMILQVENKGLKLEKDVPEGLPLIEGDEDKLTDMLTNILDNAIKFTPSGGRITVGAFEEKESLHITISDTGIGIRKELIPNLFQRFYQIDASIRRRYGGTGLGLYISKNIVEAHKGNIWIESEEGVGTTVHITLPK